MDKKDILTEIKSKYPNFNLFLEFSNEKIKKEDLIFLFKSNNNISENIINEYINLIFENSVKYLNLILNRI